MKFLLHLFILLWVTALTSCTSQGTFQKEKTTAQVYQLLQEGKHFEQNKNVKQALICYWNALDLLEEEQDTILKASTYNRLGDLLFRYGLYEKAVESHRKGYNLAQRTDNHRLLYETTTRLSLDYTLLNQGDTARYFSTLSQQIANKNNLACPPAEGASLTSPVLSTQKDSIGSLYEREQLLNWEARYKQQKAQLQAERIRNERLTYLSAGLGIILFLLVLLFITYRRKKHEEQRREKEIRWFRSLLDENRKEIENYQTELFNSHTHIRELQRTLEESHASLEENRLLHEELAYYLQQEQQMRDKEQSLRTREQLLLSENSLKAVELLNRMKNKPTFMPVSSKEEWQVLTDFMDILYDGYSQTIRNLRGLTERDRELCYLMRLGFTTGQMAVFYGISPGSVTKAKFRIQKKMEAELPADSCPETASCG